MTGQNYVVGGGNTTPATEINQTIEQTAQNAPQMGENATSTAQNVNDFPAPRIPTKLEECQRLIISQQKLIASLERQTELLDQNLSQFRQMFSSEYSVNMLEQFRDFLKNQKEVSRER